jgi:Lon protease-like protein
MPLFPLGTVLFPGFPLPLHIFEDRYRQLVRDLQSMDRPSRRFGVVAIRSGREVGAEGVQALYEVGCIAVLDDVEAYDDGRFDIETTGLARFRLGSLDTSSPYLRAEVSQLSEQDGPDSGRLAGLVAESFTTYLEVLTGEAPDLPSDPTRLSYLVAGSAVLDLADKQQLLQAENAATRLTDELALLRRELALIDVVTSLPAVDLTRGAVSRN